MNIPRRELRGTRALDLGEHTRPKEARRLHDLLLRFVLPGSPTGTRLADEESLAREFQCSRNTVRDALASLVESKVIERVVGQGTYVVAPPSIWNSTHAVDTYQQTVAGRGHSLELVGKRVIQPLPASIARTAPYGATGLAIVERMLRVDGRAASLRTYYIPVADPSEADAFEASTDLVAWVVDRHAGTRLRSERRISAVGADKSAAASLDLERGAPLLLVTTTMRDPDGGIVLANDSRLRTDLMQIALDGGGAEEQSEVVALSDLVTDAAADDEPTSSTSPRTNRD